MLDRIEVQPGRPTASTAVPYAEAGQIDIIGSDRDHIAGVATINERVLDPLTLDTDPFIDRYMFVVDAGVDDDRVAITGIVDGLLYRRIVLCASASDMERCAGNARNSL